MICYQIMKQLKVEPAKESPNHSKAEPVKESPKFFKIAQAKESQKCSKVEQSKPKVAYQMTTSDLKEEYNRAFYKDNELITPIIQPFYTKQNIRKFPYISDEEKKQYDCIDNYLQVVDLCTEISKEEKMVDQSVIDRMRAIAEKQYEVYAELKRKMNMDTACHYERELTGDLNIEKNVDEDKAQALICRFKW
ncbi:uncharacterized protein LOC101452857 isoform X2 [Ceratitis capitata]|nr:uncharacterized protein LOC101452857 isoform X2 [Ceratitis capitata]XP_004537433.1 uncharacterized protein LOC101452857 isoform X2 [Ceratitis capitata]XP_012162172.1 uncharacterized protein LOC101452857 isoform X2 [Ceratitis capitata]XP_020717715.1 uncharacterized protein LOC101452857 isoform X2 [Ceratitis capitata]